MELQILPKSFPKGVKGDLGSSPGEVRPKNVFQQWKTCCPQRRSPSSFRQASRGLGEDVHRNPFTKHWPQTRASILIRLDAAMNFRTSLRMTTVCSALQCSEVVCIRPCIYVQRRWTYCQIRQAKPSENTIASFGISVPGTLLISGSCVNFLTRFCSRT